MTRKNQVLNYRTERSAVLAMRRLLKRYPVHPDCKVDVVQSPSWLYPFMYLIRVTGRDGSSGYWSRA
jgi:late competence protein required for DNA uptake (superfamily II DNA/RNA helicase)